MSDVQLTLPYLKEVAKHCLDPDPAGPREHEEEVINSPFVRPTQSLSSMQLRYHCENHHYHHHASLQ